MSSDDQAVGRRAAGMGRWLTVFALSGGILAWAVHLFLAWSVLELTCSHARADVSGVPLTVYVALATAVPGLVAIAAGTAAWFIHSRLRDVTGPRLLRARFLAQLGLALNALALTMIIFGGIGVAVFPPCD